MLIEEPLTLRTSLVLPLNYYLWVQETFNHRAVAYYPLLTIHAV
jgi:hypothetical protein